jgi:hypothetical protein
MESITPRTSAVLSIGFFSFALPGSLRLSTL